MPRVYFLVLTHERPRGLLALLHSIFASRFPRDVSPEVLIWDNASHPDVKEAFLRSAYGRDRRVAYLRSEENSLMRGKLYLEEAALDRWDGSEDACLVHLDDDVQVTPGWLPSTLGALRARGWAACGSVEDWAGRRVYSGQTQLQIRSQALGVREVRVWDWVWEPAPVDRADKAVEFAGHRALLVRMPVASVVRHDPAMLIGGEDLDYSLSIRAAGFTLGISHGALIHHRSLGETDAPGFRTRERVLESWRHFHAKWGFVRRNACTEAGLSEEKWLSQFAESDAR